MDATLFTPKARCGIVPRQYQTECHDESFRIFDAGTLGALIRCFTGGGKTLMCCLIADTWLSRGNDYRVMVISYETQLVWQFAQEIEDYLGIVPGIEMDSDRVSHDDIPKITVASRASLLRAAPATPEQIDQLASFGITELGACYKSKAKTYLNFLKKGGDPDAVRDDLRELNARPEANGGYWSRLHKFDWRYNWLVVWDEGHRHAYKLASVGHVVDWFNQNDMSRRIGPTATPKRGDKTSLGDKMFVAIAIDYPLFRLNGVCAVRDGYAVPYVQKYIAVEGVDFKQIFKIKDDFEQAAELERQLGEEGKLAKLVEPLLDMVGNRRCLIFSPGVDMAKNVAKYINARSEAKCTCGKVKWYPTRLIGDGAQCPECKRFIEASDITKKPEQAKELDGSSPDSQRKEVYRGHQSGAFQFLSVCGLCREGYNDPDIACVAIFRPVSKDASSLAEQMKGRGCRPLRSVANKLHECPDAESRCRMIAESAKPNCLIIDLVGVTGLADCASTVDIYAEGLPDEVKQRAEEILAEEGIEEEVSVEDALIQAQREDEEAKERIRLEREAAEKRSREEFERRAKADAQVKYTTHDVGYGSPDSYDPHAATEKQYNFIEGLGMKLFGVSLSKRQAGRIIDMLQDRKPLSEVAYENGLKDDQWEPAGPSGKQAWRLNSMGLPKAATRHDASLLIDAGINAQAFIEKMIQAIRQCESLAKLHRIGKDLAVVKPTIDFFVFKQAIDAGVAKKQELEGR